MRFLPMDGRSRIPRKPAPFQDLPTGLGDSALARAPLTAICELWRGFKLILCGIHDRRPVLLFASYLRHRESSRLGHGDGSDQNFAHT
jgi:hypothetical protein